MLLSLRFVPAVTVLALAALVGCRTTEDVLRDYERNFTVGRYAEAMKEPAELAAKGDDSALLWHLLAGGAAQGAGQTEAARVHFDAAEDVMQANDQKSVFASGGDAAFAMMTNDRAFPYDGGGQDRIFTCLYKAIGFLCSGSRNGARTELNRALQHQDNWLDDRRKEIAQAEKRLEKDVAAYEKDQEVEVEGDRAEQRAAVLGDADFLAQLKAKCHYDVSVSGDLSQIATRDYANTYAQHVAGVFRWIDGSGGTKILKDVAALAPNTTAARDAAEAASGVRPTNQVWIWVEDGLCPAREEWRIDLPLVVFPGLGRYILYAGMAFPKQRERTWGAVSWRAETASGTQAFQNLTDVDHLLKTEYDVYMRGALTREITRTAVKTGLQIALGVAANNTNNSNHQLALLLSQAGVAAWAVGTTAADLRCWTSLPKSVKCLRVDRPADGRLVLWADGQKITLSLPEGNSLVFIRKPSPQALPTFRQATVE